MVALRPVPDRTMVSVAFRNWKARTGEQGEQGIEVLAPVVWAECREAVLHWAQEAGDLYVSALGHDQQCPEHIASDALVTVVLVGIPTDRLSAARQRLTDVVGPDHLGALWWMPSPAMRAFRPDIPTGALRPRPEL